jgi:hypothetical protein
MWMIKPRYEPRTDLALDFSSVDPGVQITNHEMGERTYQLIIYSDNSSARVTQKIVLEKDRSYEVNLRPLSKYFPPQGRIYLDLYIEGQEKPYRSLHFLLEELPKESQLITEQPQVN